MPRFSRHRAFLFASIVVCAIACNASAQLAPPGLPKGATEQQVIAALGWPTGRAIAEDRVIWSYPGYRVVFDAGKVEVIHPVPKQSAASRPPRKSSTLREVPPTKYGLSSPAARLEPQQYSRKPVSPAGPQAMPQRPSKNAQANLAVKSMAPWWTALSWLTGLTIPCALLALAARLANKQKRRRHTVGWENMPPLSRELAADLRATAAEQLPRRPNHSNHRATPHELTIDNLRELEWKRLEELAAYFFSAQGWKSDLGNVGPDGGVDVRLRHREDPNRRAYVQCKAWSDQHLVGVKPVRELFGVMAAEEVSEGWFVTTSDFTADARAFAAGKPLALLNGRQLVLTFNQLPLTDQRRTLEHVFRGDYRTPSCPKCGTKMVEKGGDEPFWGCRNFPRCRGKPINIRRPVAHRS